VRPAVSPKPQYSGFEDIVPVMVGVAVYSSKIVEETFLLKSVLEGSAEFAIDDACEEV
jgi:hypothetical protein